MINESQKYGFLSPLSEDAQLVALKAYWSAVKQVFPEAWSLPPGESKLTHGAGIYALGKLMDMVLPRVAGVLWGSNPVPNIVTELNRIKDRCVWTEPTDSSLTDEWENDWKPLQNLKRDKDILAKRIMGYYVRSLSQ